MIRKHPGSCHCGNVRVELETSIEPSAWILRSCTCGFCSRHGARTMGDPKGFVRIDVADASAVLRYSFGRRSCEFILCGRCGSYVVGYLETDDGHERVTLNVNMLEISRQLTQAATPVTYEDEPLEDRLARRMERWTPANLKLGA